MSKGSKSRVSDLNKYRENYDRIFRKEKFKQLFAYQVYGMKKINLTDEEAAEELLRKKQHQLTIDSIVTGPTGDIGLTGADSHPEDNRVSDPKEEDERTEHDDECGV